MLDIFDKEVFKENHEAEITRKYWKLWKELGRVDKLDLLKKELSEQLLSFCDLEIRKKHALCLKMINDMSKKLQEFHKSSWGAVPSSGHPYMK